MTLPVRLSLDWCGAQWPRVESTVAGNRGMDRLDSRRWDGARRDFCYIFEGCMGLAGQRLHGRRGKPCMGTCVFMQKDGTALKMATG